MCNQFVRKLWSKLLTFEMKKVSNEQGLGFFPIIERKKRRGFVKSTLGIFFPQETTKLYQRKYTRRHSYSLLCQKKS